MGICSSFCVVAPQTPKKPPLHENRWPCKNPNKRNRKVKACVKTKEGKGKPKKTHFLQLPGREIKRERNRNEYDIYALSPISHLPPNRMPSFKSCAIHHLENSVTSLVSCVMRKCEMYERMRMCVAGCGIYARNRHFFLSQ